MSGAELKSSRRTGESGRDDSAMVPDNISLTRTTSGAANVVMAIEPAVRLFDLVVLIDPDALRTDIEGTVDRYVATTRATQQLVILTSP